ncbi:MAG: sporulation transcription factor Spo0A [Clostridia bacterium]|nr:sporulation transcription factor Spo0A [Clostridia bacterium]
MKFNVALFIEDGIELSERINSTELFKVVAATGNGHEALKLAEELNPDFIVTDLVLKGMDGLTLIERLKGVNSKIIVYSSFDSAEIIDSAKRKGAALYLVKPLEPEIIIRRMKDLMETESREAPTADGNRNDTENFSAEDGAAELRISNVFLSAGIPPHIKGYGFLRTGVKLAMKNPAILGNITKELYPEIACGYGTTPSKVERAIRHAIEVAWNRGRIQNLNNIFGVNFYSNGDKPTNGEFIALVADRLIQEKRMGKL